MQMSQVVYFYPPHYSSPRKHGTTIDAHRSIGNCVGVGTSCLGIVQSD